MKKQAELRLTFRQSTIGCYQIVEVSDGRRYVMDTSTVMPKTFFWGALPAEVSADIVELRYDNHEFELPLRPPMDTTLAAVMAQPIVKILDGLFRSVFGNYNLSQQVLVKLILFILSMVIAYLVVLYSLKRAHQRASAKLPKDVKHKRMIFKTNGKRDYTGYFALVLNLICLAFYLGINDGAEGGLLVVNGLISLLTFIICRAMLPISAEYRREVLLFDKIIDVE
ncbi:hypothetical protein BU202_01870 [Streptococcus cuniculi]|uniref:DUF443 family protein n=1 Tax=Streptococcus cuniculi TaxID=1432788 RepID=A0A1Q8E9C2_9STRE|nr:DUF443 family protein [Streptococcus cuniculi]OLF48390.1 hypothetical protein BU202_01870 [Streptococcus cuniculi]